MKWPRGKYNGRRIVGVRVQVMLNIRYWDFHMRWNFGEPYIICGPIQVRFELNYGVTGK